MEIQLVLTACMVTFGITSILSENELADQGNTPKTKGDGEIRENFLNLVLSIARNDTQNSEIYRKVLKREATKQQRAFDAIREEIQLARNRNLLNRKNYFEKNKVTWDEKSRLRSRRYVVKTVPEDQEYAEYYFLHPELEADDPKTCFRKDLRNRTNVCDLETGKFFEMCTEVAEVECIRSLFITHKLDPDRTPEPCQNYTVKIFRVKTKDDVHRIEARPCPTVKGGHPLWLSKGYERGSIFVYSENFATEEQLRVEDYIVFEDKLEEF